MRFMMRWARGPGDEIKRAVPFKGEMGRGQMEMGRLLKKVEKATTIR
jgi:hypothetical protein